MATATRSKIIAEMPDSRVTSPLTLRRQELHLMSRIYATEERLLEPVEDPDRDALVLAACTAMLKDAAAHARDRRLAFETAEMVYNRMARRRIEAQKNATERLKVKAAVATSAARSWQPNGRQQPPPDPELQAMIHGAGANSDG